MSTLQIAWDGRLYTKIEFQEHYKEYWCVAWDNASEAVFEGPLFEGNWRECRKAWDGKYYTKGEFRDHYGLLNAPFFWFQAAPWRCDVNATQEEWWEMYLDEHRKEKQRYREKCGKLFRDKRLSMMVWRR